MQSDSLMQAMQSSHVLMSVRAIDVMSYRQRSGTLHTVHDWDHGVLLNDRSLMSGSTGIAR